MLAKGTTARAIAHNLPMGRGNPQFVRVHIAGRRSPAVGTLAACPTWPMLPASASLQVRLRQRVVESKRAESDGFEVRRAATAEIENRFHQAL